MQQRKTAVPHTTENFLRLKGLNGPKGKSYQENFKDSRRQIKKHKIHQENFNF